MRDSGKMVSAGDVGEGVPQGAGAVPRKHLQNLTACTFLQLTGAWTWLIAPPSLPSLLCFSSAQTWSDFPKRPLAHVCPLLQTLQCLPSPLTGEAKNVTTVSGTNQHVLPVPSPTTDPSLLSQSVSVVGFVAGF